jgi:hypothetical protein
MQYVYRHGKRIAVKTLYDPRPKKRRPFKAQWVQLPNYWIERLRQARNISTIMLAHVILREAYRRQCVGGEIVLSTEVTGLSRQVRWKAVRELRELELIETEQNGNQAVRVILLIKKKRITRGPVYLTVDAA